MKRRPEPELMLEAEQVLAYAQADFSEANAHFIRLLEALKPGELAGARALDLGCGPADIVLRFLKAYPRAECDALDGSAAMLSQARRALDQLPGLAGRCRLLQDTLPSARIPESAYDLVLSSSLLHHLHDPQVLWQSIRAAAKPGAIVLVMDLMRPRRPCGPNPWWPPTRRAPRKSCAGTSVTPSSPPSSPRKSSRSSKRRGSRHSKSASSATATWPYRADWRLPGNGNRRKRCVWGSQKCTAWATTSSSSTPGIGTSP